MAVEAVDAQHHAALLDELLQVGAPAHRDPTIGDCGAGMIEFARTGSAVGATAATLEKTRILAAYLRTLDDDDLRRAAVFMTGRAFGPSQRRTLGLGWRALSKVDHEHLRPRRGRARSPLPQALGPRRLGRRSARRAAPTARPSSLAEVSATLEAIRTARGNAKAAPLEALLRRIDAETARFVVKIIAGEMRIGLSEGLVEAAIAEAFDVPITQVKRVHLVTGDIGETAVRCKHRRVRYQRRSRCSSRSGSCSRAPWRPPQEAFERMGADKRLDRGEVRRRALPASPLRRIASSCSRAT